MKLLVFLSCTLALATASWIPFFGHHKEEHHPVIHDGVPLDTPEVQHARAEHLAAVAEAKAHAGYHHEEEIQEEHHDFGGNQLSLGDDHHDDHHGYGYSIQHISKPSYHHEELEHTSYVDHPVHVHSEHHHPAFETSHHEPLIDHDGKPLDTPEVEKAKALHFAEVHKALARLHGHGHHGLHRRDLGDYSLHVDHEHSHGYELHQNHAPVYGHHEDVHHHHEIPQIGHDGKPLDTAEVEHAKALHFAAHQEALARNQHAKQHQIQELSFHHY